MWHGPGLAGEKPVSKLPDAKEYLTVRLEAPKEPPACSCIRKTVLAHSYGWHCDSRPPTTQHSQNLSASCQTQQKQLLAVLLILG